MVCRYGIIIKALTIKDAARIEITTAELYLRLIRYAPYDLFRFSKIMSSKSIRFLKRLFIIFWSIAVCLLFCPDFYCYAIDSIIMPDWYPDVITAGKANK